MYDFLIAHHWFFIAACGLAGAAAGWITGSLADRILRAVGVSRGWRSLASAGATVILMGTVLLGADRYFDAKREECCRARVTEWLEKSPYATLVEHHPEAKTALINAFTKIGLGDKDAIVGHAEMNAVLTHYLRLYLPVTSDRAAREFVMAATALIDVAIITEPEICVAYLNGRSQNLNGRMPAHVLKRYGDAIGAVLTEGIRNPQSAPDPGTIRWQRQKVVERMRRDGNPLATDPKRLQSDPNRACFALLAVMQAVGATIPANEVGAFLRGALPAHMQENGA